jgi:ATP-binding cassette subfamily F protein 3
LLIASHLPDNSKIILNRVNFDVGLDTRIAIVGSNGAGKSTFVGSTFIP